MIVLLFYIPSDNIFFFVRKKVFFYRRDRDRACIIFLWLVWEWRSESSQFAFLFNNQNTSAVTKTNFPVCLFCLSDCSTIHSKCLSPPRQTRANHLSGNAALMPVTHFCLLLLSRCDSPPSHCLTCSALTAINAEVLV